MRRRFLWPWFSIITFLPGLAGVLWYFSRQSKDVVEKADSLSSVGGLVVSVSSLAVSMVALLLTLRQPAGGQGATTEITAAATELAAVLHDQWHTEIGVRRLQHPRPLGLHWARPDVDVTVRQPARQPWSGALVHPGDDRLPAADLVDLFEGLPARQLVIIGGPGAGKSVLAVLFTVALLEAVRRPPRPEEPDPTVRGVPMLLTASGWDPQEPLDTWVARRIAEEVPQLTDAARFGEDAPARLVRADRVIVVLDGLDELPPQRLAKALAAIDDTTGRRAVVATCRSLEYLRALTDEPPLSRAAVVAIKPIELDDAIDFLTSAEKEGTTRWQTVVDHIRTHPDSHLTAAFSNPLMIALARTVYRSPRSTPDELVALGGAGAVRQHLLREFLPIAYRPTPSDVAAHDLHAYRPERAVRWLTVLAHHLDTRPDPGDPATADDDATQLRSDISWWTLARAVPPWWITVLVAVTVCVGGVLAGIGFSLVDGEPIGRAVRISASLGLPIGLIAGLSAARHATTPPRVRTMAARALRDGVAGGLVCTLLVAAAGKRPFATTWDYVESVSGLAVVCMVSGINLSMITNGLQANRSSLPHRPTLRLGAIFRALLSGVGTGLLFGLPSGLVAGTVAGVLDWTIGTGLVAAGLVALIATVMIGVPVGIGRWIGAPMEAGSAPSPRSTLRGDRLVLWAIVAAITVPLALASSGVAAFLDEDPVVLGLWTWLAAGALVTFGSGSPWLSYTATRWWLALWGQLPWRLMRFLEDAHRRGVLRQIGATFQFRHGLLQDHLARRHARSPTARLAMTTPVDRRPAVEPAGRPAEEGTGRWAVAGVVVAVVTLLAATGVITVPRVREVWQQRATERAVADLLRQADALEQRDAELALRLRIAAYHLRGEAREPVIPLSFYTRMRLTGAVVSHTVAPQCWCQRSIGQDGAVGLDESREGTLAVLTGAGPPRRATVGGGVWEVEASKDAHRAVVTYDSGRVAVWDLTATPPTSTSLDTHSTTLRKVGISEDGRWALLTPTIGPGADAGSRELWDVSADPPRRADIDLSSDDGTTRVSDSIFWSPNARWLATVSPDAGMRLWDMSGAVPRRQPLPTEDAGSRDIEFDATGRHALLLRADGTVVLWDLDAGQPRRTEVTAPSPEIGIGTDGHAEVGTAVRAIAISPDGRWATSADAGGRGRLWDLSTSPPRGVTMPGGVKPDSRAAFSTDGSRAATVRPDGTALLWDLTRTPPHPTPFGRATSFVELNANGRRALTFDRTHRLTVWNLDQPAHPLGSRPVGSIPLFEGQTGGFFSPDGRWMITSGGSFARGDTVWSMAGRAPRPVTVFAERPAFGADGHTVLVADEAVIGSWDLDTLARHPSLSATDGAPGHGDAPERDACRAVARGLNAREWALHVPDLAFVATC